MPNWILEVVKIGPHYIVRPPVPLGNGPAGLGETDEVTHAIGEEYAYPVARDKTVISIVREFLENIPKEETQTP